MQQTEKAAAVTDAKALAPDIVVVIGAGTGGPLALAAILPKLPKSFPASIIVIQQMRPGFTRLLAQELARSGGLPIAEAEDHGELLRGRGLMAPGGHGLTFTQTKAPEHQFTVNLEDHGDSGAKSRTRIDNAMKCAAEIFGVKAVGVLLTGAGFDGREGMKAIRAAGGKTLAQNMETSVLYDMPGAAVDAGAVDEILPLWAIADRLAEIVENL